MEVTKKDIGKRVTFKLKYCKWNPVKETRIIKDVTETSIIIRYNGWKKFLLKRDEVIRVV